MIRILQDVFRAMIKKRFEHDENFDIVINADKGDLEIMRFREIVDDNSEDIWDFDKIKLSDAKKIEKDFEVGDEVAEEIKIEDFDALSKHLNEFQKKSYSQFKDYKDDNKIKKSLKNILKRIDAYV